MFDRINYIITTRCNWACSTCCCNNQHGGDDYPVGNLLADLRMLGKIDTLVVTGGEPTVHADFRYFSIHMRRFVDARSIELYTNGSRQWMVEWSRRFYDRIVETGDKSSHLSQNDGLRQTSCGRDAGHAAAYKAGHMYRCCVAPSIDGSPSTPLDIGWRWRLATVGPQPCHLCHLAQE